MKKFWVVLLVLGGISFSAHTRELRPDYRRANQNSKFKSKKYERKTRTQSQLNKKLKWTPFIIAASENNVRTMELLYKKNRNVVNEVTSDGGTSLMEAARNNSIAALEWFKMHKLLGKFINKQDKKFGNTALIETAFAGNRAVQAYQWLIKNGANVNLKNKKGYTALSIKNAQLLIRAAMLGNVTLVKKLLKAHMPAGLRDSSANTALLYACMNSTTGRNKRAYNEIAVALINAGAKVNVIGQYKMTPLLWAVMNNNPVVVKLLLQKGADVNVENYQKMTPLSLAVLGSKTNVLKVLLMSDKIEVNGNFKHVVAQALKMYKQGLKAHPPKGFEQAHKKGMMNLNHNIIMLKRYAQSHVTVEERLEKAKEMIAKDLEREDSLNAVERQKIAQVLGPRYKCPRGSYQQYCGLCSCTETEMTCYCVSKKGKLRKSTIRTNLKKGEFIQVNKNGILERVRKEEPIKPKKVFKGARKALFKSSPSSSSSEHVNTRRLFTNTDK